MLKAKNTDLRTIAGVNSRLHWQSATRIHVYNHNNTRFIHKSTSVNWWLTKFTIYIQNCKLPYRNYGQNTNVYFLEPQLVFFAIFSPNLHPNTAHATLDELSAGYKQQSQL